MKYFLCLLELEQASCFKHYGLDLESYYSVVNEIIIRKSTKTQILPPPDAFKYLTNVFHHDMHFLAKSRYSPFDLHQNHVYKDNKQEPIAYY